MDFRNTNIDIRRNIHTDIPSQFPQFYLEQGKLYVEFVKAYYEYLDQNGDSFRDAYNIRDVDTTYEKFLEKFQLKYLKDFPKTDNLDTRFLIKHIQDLYRRKGSEESLRLLFRMFFDEEIEVFYPSTAILKPSASNYKFDYYLEMKPLINFEVEFYQIRKGDIIRGNTSNATGVVDEVIFENLDGIMVPILYLSNVKGNFINDDGLFVTVRRANDDGILIQDEFGVGKLIHGSISNISISRNRKKPGNFVGDIITLRSSERGFGASARVSEIFTFDTGSIGFEIENAGFGYTVNDANTVIKKSNQTLTLDANTDVTFTLETEISVSSANVLPINVTSNTDYSNTFIDGTAEIIGYDSNLKQLYVAAANSTVAFSDLPDGGKFTLTYDGANVDVIAVSTFNDTADFFISRIENAETVSLILDVIGNFTSVPLNSSDYGMSGSGAETISTVINDAFDRPPLEVGEISRLRIVDGGIDYQTDIATIITQPILANRYIYNAIITFQENGFFLQPGDIMTQTRQIEGADYNVRAEFIESIGRNYYFQYKSVYGFDDDEPVIINNNEYNIDTIDSDFTSSVQGNNAIIFGNAFFQGGQINSLQILDTGFQYRDGEIVELVNSANVVVGEAIIQVRGNGFTEGFWTTSTSFISESTKVIRDNDYYQEYSYDISSPISPDVYSTLTKNLVQVAGTKQFESTLINTNNSLSSTLDLTFEVYDLTFPPLTDESGNTNSIAFRIEEANTELVAVIATLDANSSAQIQEDIND